MLQKENKKKSSQNRTNMHAIDKGVEKGNFLYEKNKLNLDSPDSCYWRYLKSINVRISKRNFGVGSVMVWACLYLF